MTSDLMNVLSVDAVVLNSPSVKRSLPSSVIEHCINPDSSSSSPNHSLIIKHNCIPVFCVSWLSGSLRLQMTVVLTGIMGKGFNVFRLISKACLATPFLSLSDPGVSGLALLYLLVTGGLHIKSVVWPVWTLDNNYSSFYRIPLLLSYLGCFILF